MPKKKPNTNEQILELLKLIHKDLKDLCEATWDQGHYNRDEWFKYHEIEDTDE